VEEDAGHAGTHVGRAEGGEPADLVLDQRGVLGLGGDDADFRGRRLLGSFLLVAGGERRGEAEGQQGRAQGQGLHENFVPFPGFLFVRAAASG
jgi:hypothetical protein